MGVFLEQTLIQDKPNKEHQVVFLSQKLEFTPIPSL